MHNETVNIYSHLIPTVLLLLSEWHIQQYIASRHSGVTSTDSIFVLTTVTCLSLSAIYHSLLNHSKHVEHLCLRLDMLGVVIFILGDVIFGIYIFIYIWCEPLSRNIYWSMVSGSIYGSDA